MYFSKDEVIELNDKRKFLVVDTALIDDNAYFKIIKLDEEEKPTEETEYISVQNDNGRLYINEHLKDKELAKLTEFFS